MGFDNSFRHYTWSRHHSIILNIVIMTICIVAYGFNRFFLKDILNWLFLRCYLNDVLAGALMLAYTNVLFSIVRKDEHSLISLPIIMIFILLAGFFWEFATPLFHEGSVTDYADIAAYLVGGIVYWLIVQARFWANSGDTNEGR
jgi:hypothetical protein